jgi:hypothetical protein
MFFFVVADEVNETLSVAYHDAFVVALTVVVAMVVAALIFALLDARVRDKEPQAAANPEALG